MYLDMKVCGLYGVEGTQYRFSLALISHETNGGIKCSDSRVARTGSRNWCAWENFCAHTSSDSAHIAKNIILAGVKSVTLYDPEPVALQDLSSQVCGVLPYFELL